MHNLRIETIELNDDIFSFDPTGWKQLLEWKPETSDNFSIFIRLKVGFRDELGADIFYIMVLSRQYYEKMSTAKARDIRRKWKHFVIESYDWHIVWRELSRRLTTSDMESWHDSLALLRKNFSWEFENMNKPAPPEMH